LGGGRDSGPGFSKVMNVVEGNRGERGGGKITRSRPVGGGSQKSEVCELGSFKALPRESRETGAKCNGGHPVRTYMTEHEGRD